ncbi:MAG: GGDEF domain-containing protein [Cyanobacteria bacterium J06643_5]
MQQKINELEQIKKLLYQSNAILESILNTSLDGIAAMQAVRDSITGEITDFRFLMPNPVIAKFFYSSQEDLIGDYLLNTKIFQDNTSLFNCLVEVVETRKPFNQELYYEINNNQNWYQIIAVSLGDGITLTIRDITQTKLLELELTRQARVDSLNNLSNRQYFNEYLAQEWHRYKRENNQYR